MTRPTKKVFITSADIDAALGKGVTLLSIGPNTVVTDEARERAERLGVSLVREKEGEPSDETAAKRAAQHFIESVSRHSHAIPVQSEARSPAKVEPITPKEALQRRLVEYKPGAAFAGIIGRTMDESSPAWPEPIRAKEGAPNVLIIVLDDVGFGQLGCYGGPVLTPHIDSLAEDGLRYSNMHTTAMCSPTRACLITGRNHHSNGMGGIIETSTGFPGGNAQIPFENGFLSEILLQHGYNTYAVGKWHLTPAEQTSAAGPYDRWPLGRGFERFYGFFGGDTHQYYPALVRDNQQIKQDKLPEDGYHLSEDLADKAIQMIADAKQVAPNKPFFLYYCPGAGHAPHHVAREWADKYKGKFDHGWEEDRRRTFERQKALGVIPEDTELSRPDPDVQDWNNLSTDERRLYARMMEVFAGFMSHCDYHIGRILEFLKSLGEYDNTLIMLISDNGASAEGGPIGAVNENAWFNCVADDFSENLRALDTLGDAKYFNHYPWGWAHAGNTPFRRWKRETYRGGISDPLVVSWPKHIKARGEVRTQYCHAIDIVPTVLEALNIEPPSRIKGYTQSPMEGVSFASTFSGNDVVGKHVTQYFMMYGHRSIYHDGWKAVCPWVGTSFKESGRTFGMPMTADTLRELDAKHWELYHVAEDFAENHNVANQNPEKLLEMIAIWYAEAGKYGLFPIDSRGQARFADPRPQIAGDRTFFTYYPNTQGVPQNATGNVLNRSHRITAYVDFRKGDEGVLLSQGGCDGGYSFYVQGGKLHYVHNFVAQKYFHAVSSEEIPEGKVELGYAFEAIGKPEVTKGIGSPGKGRLFIGDRLVGDLDLPITTPLMFGLASWVTCGANPGSPVTPDYKPPFAFSGKLARVEVRISGTISTDRAAVERAALAHQ